VCVGGGGGEGVESSTLLPAEMQSVQGVGIDFFTVLKVAR
jgi:hypothetical protein